MIMAASVTQSFIYSFVGMGVVFAGLVILYYSMIFLERLLNPRPAPTPQVSEATASRSGEDRRACAERRAGGDTDSEISGSGSPLEGVGSSDDPKVQAEMAAAVIAVSLYIYNRKYDEAKQFILTGKKMDIPNKPWTMSGRLREVARDSARFSK